MKCLRVGRVNFLMLILIIIYLNILLLTPSRRNVVEAAFPFGIFPILPSEWYYKPTPKEQVVLGLILVKVMALRLASVVGLLPIPYHLHDLFTVARALGKRSLREQGHILRNLTVPPMSPAANKTASLNPVPEMLRMFTVIREMDRNNCFLKTLCIVSSSTVSDPNSRSAISNRKILNMIRYLSWIEQVGMKDKTKPGVMEPFLKSIRTGWLEHSVMSTSCSTEYPMCSLPTEKVLKYDSMIMSMF